MKSQIVAIVVTLLTANAWAPSRSVRMRAPALSQSATTSTADPATGLIKREKILTEPKLWEYNFGLQDPKLALPHDLEARVSPPETFEITEEQIRTLEEDGVLLIKKAFDEDWIEYLRSATGEQVDNPHFWSFAGTASKLYDYIQRNIWQTNAAFSNFYYHSAVGDILRQLGRTDEIRLSTDLLMVNPNKGFKWHQDNQNGPITVDDGLRFWISMDATPSTHGSPVYLKQSHENTVVEEEAVFVDINMPGLEAYRSQQLKFQISPGDMLIWHPKTVHKIDGAPDGIWDSYRRVLGGTVAKGGAKYQDKTGSGGVLSDLGRHSLVQGDKLDSAFFPVIYPRFNPNEASARDEGVVGRNPKDIVSKLGGLAGKAAGSRFFSFFQVLGSGPGTGDHPAIKLPGAKK